MRKTVLSVCFWFVVHGLESSGPSLGRSGLDRKALIGAPFRPRPVVDGRLAMPDLGKGERESGRGDAGTATRHHRLAEVDIGLLEQKLDLARF
jgi:hypothetical protein